MAVDVLTGVDLSKDSYDSYKYTDARRLLEQYGHLKDCVLPTGEMATILPQFDIPCNYLDSSNWVRTIPLGNFRNVRAIRFLPDTTKPAIVGKSPERAFTRGPNQLEKGYPWWGGEKSGERPICIQNNPVVEEQAVWEAITLLELRKQGVRAEIPQALIQYKDGKMELIVREISSRESAKRNGPSWHEMLNRITEIGLVPVDSGGHNLLTDEQGNITLIDTNRWLWPPYTDNYRIRLVSEITATIFSSGSLVPGG